MTPADLSRLSVLLDEALDLPLPEREHWLAALDGESAALAPTLRHLLSRSALKETGDLLEGGPSFTAPGGPDTAPTFHGGDTVGPYQLLRPLGQGGMGEVWLAEHSAGLLKRQVALKLPVLGLRRSLLLQRFARERDILAALAHPHIARLYDAGLAEDGQPYLALEFVDGQPVTAFCDARQLDIRARVQLLLQVMGAVQYAHAHLVIHRDLKPSNVLVTAEGQAMLLDFGIAKLLAADETSAESTELTQVSGRALTLEYAAPEQVGGAAVSTATDVYALGVLLYELLSGRRPFGGTRREKEAAILAAEPPHPAALPSDLATIALKALKKAPAERYATVNAMAEDLGRWLRGEPVLAQPDSFAYRLRKFIARRRVPVTALQRSDAERAGHTTLGEWLRSLPYNNGGSSNPANADGGSNPGYASLTLRGAGASATLVQVDGRRVAPFAFSGVAVDINSRPLAAIERVEVLRDGGSALYGAEAVAGVVNVILRRGFDGVEAVLGGRRADANSGIDGFIVFDYREQLPLPAARRAFGRSALRPEQGFDETSAFGFPGAYAFDLATPYTDFSSAGLDCDPQRYPGAAPAGTMCRLTIRCCLRCCRRTAPSACLPAPSRRWASAAAGASRPCWLTTATATAARPRRSGAASRPAGSPSCCPWTAPTTRSGRMCSSGRDRSNWARARPTRSRPVGA